MCRCIPYRYKIEEDGTTTNDMEVLLISSQKGQGLMFPKVIKITSLAQLLFISFFLRVNRSELNSSSILLFCLQGGWEIDESDEEAALRESLEEAGVIGDVKVSILLFYISNFCFLKGLAVIH